MEYASKDMDAAGDIPQCGAIFMTNTSMMKVCFKHRVFGQTLSKAQFVKLIKSGMALFLFEYEKRELFGVYQAISNGEMGIVPQGFHYRGKHFPAQVRFKQIWECNPLSEHEFRDAIMENYFSSKKFNLGLSEDQVHRLLLLFSTRKLKYKIPTRLETVVSESDGKGRYFKEDDRSSFRDRTCKEISDGIHPTTIPHNYRENSLTKMKEGYFMNRINNEGKIFNGDLGMVEDYHGEFLTKRRRMESDDRLFENNIREDRFLNNHGTLASRSIGSQKNSTAARRVGNNRQLSTETDNEDSGGKNLSPVLSAEYPMGPLNVRMADGDLFMRRNVVLGDFNMDNTFEHAFTSEQFEKPLNRSRFSVDDNMLYVDDCVHRDFNIRNFSKASVCEDGNLNLLSQSRKVTDDRQCFVNLNMENRCIVDCDDNFLSSENLNRHLQKMRTAGTRLPINERIASEPNFGNCSVRGFSSENFVNPRTVHDGKVPNIDKNVSECIANNIICSDALKHSGFIERVGGQVVDYGRSRKDGRENLEDIHNYVNPAIPSDHLSLSRGKQNLSLLSDKLLSESGCSQLCAPQSYEPSRSAFDRETIVEVLPYNPELPYITHGFSSSLAADHNSSLAPENLPYLGSDLPYNSLPKKFPLPYFPEAKPSSTYLHKEHEREERGLELCNPSHQSSFNHKIVNSLLNSNICIGDDLNTSSLVDYGGSLFSKGSKSSARTTGVLNIDGGIGFPYPFKSSEQESAFNLNIDVASKCMGEHVSWCMLDGKQILVPDNLNRSTHQSKKDFKSNDGLSLRISHSKNLKEHPESSGAPRTDSHIRRSVFTRLTSGRCNQVDEYRNDDSFSSNSCYMDTSADEVMEMLRKDNNLPQRKWKNRIVGLPKHANNYLDRKQMWNRMDFNQSIAGKRPKDSYLTTIEEGFDEVPKETRIVNFKRRSEMKKNSAVVKKVADASRETTISMEKTSKRKRLVRPVFKQSGLDCDGLASNQNSSVIPEKDDKHSQCAISTQEEKIPSNSTMASNALPLSRLQFPECDKENTIDYAQKVPESCILSSTHSELTEHTPSNVVLQSSQGDIKDTPPQEILSSEASDLVSLSCDEKISCLNMVES